MASHIRQEPDTGGSRARDNLRHEEFIRRVQFRCGLLTASAAELAVEATLTALGERLCAEANAEANAEADTEASVEGSEGASELVRELSTLSFRHTGIDLPTRLGVARDGTGNEVTLTEFSLAGLFERVGAATGVGLAQAERHACAVAGTLEEAVGDGGLDGLRSRLPDEYEFLFV